MSFKISRKVALVTGGASGIGECLIKELLRNNLKGAVIVDINTDSGNRVLKEIEKEFGPKKVVFVRANVGNVTEFEDAFKRAVDTFGQLDILVNSAGIFNDADYERCIQVNLIGTLHGNYLGLEKYLQKYRSSSEAVIINTSSVAGVEGVSGAPAYVSSKFGVHGLSLSFGGHYERTKVKVIAVCPGLTKTPILDDLATNDKYLGGSQTYLDMTKNVITVNVEQTPEFCAKKIIDIIQKAKSGTVWVIDNEEPYRFILPDRSTMNKIYL